ncbi:hypothetical protein CCH79_00007101 [Gambusia affinis]|uniref:coproporphyrinogen oxidase n=1 Tax=Gambusia affinis TaxID=33528 RepID=A0A315VDW4_GAMAF|nr:hypothetical protein CCH79_00007101 [Gambusia affinis]
MASIVLLSVKQTARAKAKRCLGSRLKGLAGAGGSSATFPPGREWLSKDLNLRFMSHGTAGRSAAGTTRRGALAFSGAAAVTAAAVVGFLANANHFQRAEMATTILQKAKKKKEEEEEEGDIAQRCRGFMSVPVTDISVLEKRKDEMSTKMEMLIMETQAEFCKALEEVDGGTFKVDKWQRKEDLVPPSRSSSSSELQCSSFPASGSQSSPPLRLPQCDRYFYVRHRGETRGIGGIFFDDLDSPDQEEVFNFVKSCARTVVPCYLPIVKKHLNDSFTQEEKDWQQVRRGRYVEFNLVYDRGVKFGLATPGSRIESILMSLPLTASRLCCLVTDSSFLSRWEYMHEPGKGSREAEMLEVLRNPKEWLMYHSGSLEFQ